jgi:hypothetical protein
MMSEREATEMARHGEVLRWSPDSDKEEMTERGPDRTIESDSTGSTPETFKSPDIVQGRVTGSFVTDTIAPFEIEARHGKSKFIYKGVSLVKETEAQESDDDSEDDVPIASVVLKKNKCSLTLQQIIRRL